MKRRKSINPLIICICFTCYEYSIVLVIVIITGLTSPNDPGKWHSMSNSSEIVKNGTQEEPFMLGAIGQYGSNRNTIGVDKTGHIKTKWYV